MRFFVFYFKTTTYRLKLQLCDKPVLGSLRPSSLMALINMCASLAAAALMPLLGAVVKYKIPRPPIPSPSNQQYKQQLSAQL
jgi:hypothetical protein